MRIIISLEFVPLTEELPMVRKASEIFIDSKLCKGCHLCIHVCPHHVLRASNHVDNRGFYLPEVADLQACTVCHLCEMECPDFAISVQTKAENQ